MTSGVGSQAAPNQPRRAFHSRGRSQGASELFAGLFGPQGPLRMSPVEHLSSLPTRVVLVFVAQAGATSSPPCSPARPPAPPLTCSAAAFARRTDALDRSKPPGLR